MTTAAAPSPWSALDLGRGLTLILDGDGVITASSTELARALGWEPSALVGRTIMSLLGDADAQCGHAEFVAAVTASGASTSPLVSVTSDTRDSSVTSDTHATSSDAGTTIDEVCLRRREGDALRLSASWLCTTGAGGAPATLVMFGTVARNRASADLRRLLEQLLQWSDAAIAMVDGAGLITSWNRGAAELLGYAPADVLGRPIGPDGLGIVTDPEVLARTLAGESITDEDAAWIAHDHGAIEVSMRTTPIADRRGRPWGATFLARDLRPIRRVEAQLRRTEAQLRHAQKMEAVGRLAGGVAHDFNNLLSVILSYALLAIEETRPGEPLRSLLEPIQHAAQSAGDLTRQLLAFSRQQILAPRILDLPEVVRGMGPMLTRVLGEDIELSLLIDRRVGAVFVDPGQLEQVIMNLIVNARDAMPEGGQLTIEVADTMLDEAYCADHVGVTPGRYVMVAVTDTGAGMDAATQAQIFEPFFTTKGAGKGTGLGLSTAFGIVRQSDGHLWVYSEPGQGSTFKVYLPRTDRARATQSMPTVAPATTLSGSETILLVEDAPAVRMTMRTILRRLGYNVLEADNGGEALLICEQYGARIHLLLTDVVMPRMNGRQLAARLTAMRPELRVLYVSGYTENTIVHHGVLDAGIHYLPKPITPDGLGRKVREVLDAP
ncbi:MAG: ATP-binding protein [Kofleriaceae bacterium]